MYHGVYCGIKKANGVLFDRGIHGAFLYGVVFIYAELP